MMEKLNQKKIAESSPAYLSNILEQDFMIQMIQKENN